MIDAIVELQANKTAYEAQINQLFINRHNSYVYDRIMKRIEIIRNVNKAIDVLTNSDEILTNSQRGTTLSHKFGLTDEVYYLDTKTHKIKKGVIKQTNFSEGTSGHYSFGFCIGNDYHYVKADKVFETKEELILSLETDN